MAQYLLFRHELLKIYHIQLLCWNLKRWKIRIKTENNLQNDGDEFQIKTSGSGWLVFDQKFF